MRPPLIIRFAILAILVGCTAMAAPETLTQSVTYNSETVTLKLKRENLRGENFELWAQNATGTYDVITPVAERSYLGTVDEYPGAVSYGILQDDGVVKGGVIFDRGRTWYTLGSSVYNASPIAQPSSFKYTPSTVTADHGGSTVYGFDIGIDARYEYFAQRGGGSVAKTLEVIEYSVAATRALYVHDALLRPYLGRVIVRTDQAQDPANGLTGGSYLDALRIHWNNNQTGADRDLVAGVSTSHVWAGLAWVSVVATGSGYSVNDSQGDGNFFNVWRHEMGHNWGLSHYDGGAPEAGTINSDNHFARMSGPELQKVLNHRDSKFGALDSEGSLATVNIPPYASYDSRVFTQGVDSQLTIDVMANDHDANGHQIRLVGVASNTFKGGTASVQNGKAVYVPRADFLGVDSFTYTIQDVSGQTATGAVAIDVQPSDRLRFYLTLDETSGTATDDRSVFDRNGTLAGTDFSTASVSGKFGNAVNLDGLDDNVWANDVKLTSNTATLSAWIKPGATTSPWVGIIFDRSTAATGINIGPSGELRYHWNNAQYNWSSGLVPTSGVWNFVALVVEPGKATMYLNNGSGFQTAVNNAAHADATFGNLTVGRDSAQTTRHFLGAIDEARIYHGVMSAAELQGVMDGGQTEGPTPFHNATNVGPVDLAWVPSAAAVQYQVYLGTDATAVQNATPASPDYQGAVTSPTLTNPPTIVSAKNYWRVDTVTATGTITGQVWSFTRNSVAKIFIANHSFELGSVGNGAPPGWTLTTSGSLGVGTGGSDGSQYLWVGPSVQLTQDLSHTLVTGETLTLNYNSSRDYQRTIQLLAKSGSTYQFIAQTTATTGSASWPDIMLTTAVSASFAGQQLALRIISGNWNEFDNFRLTTMATGGGTPNTPPTWNTSPVVKGDAAAGAPYAATLAGDATDPEAEPLTFSKVSGPAWLHVAHDGSLLGTPGTGDIGTNNFTVRTTDAAGALANAPLTIAVRANPLHYDLNGVGSGSGAAGGGSWDGSAQWSSQSAGTSASFAWINGTVPVFSAGEDATGDYTVSNSGTWPIGGFGVHNGRPLITGGSLQTILPGAVFDIESGALGARIDSPISGNGGLVKSGPGTLVLGGNNTFAGNTTITEGVLELATSAKLYNGTFNNTAILTIGTRGTWRMPNYSYAGVGQLADHRQRRRLDGGTIEITGDSHTSGQDFTVTASGGTFRYTPAGQTLTLSGNNNTNTHLGGALAIDAIGNVSVTGTSSILEGAGTLIKSGSGDLTLANAGNSFTGNLTVNAGRLLATASSSTSNSTLGAKSPARTIFVNAPGSMEWTTNNILGGSGLTATGLPGIVLNGGSLRTTRYNVIGNVTLQGASLVNSNATDPATFDGFQFIGKVTATGTATSSITTTGRGSHLRGGATTEFEVSDPSGTLQIGTVLRNGSNDYTGTASLVKTGPGTLVLDAANLYTGTSTVSAGTLAINGSITTATTVSSSATLRGMGTVQDAVMVQAGGTIAGDPGTVLNTGSLVIEDDGILSASAGIPGRLVVNGNVTLSDAWLDVLASPSASPAVLLSYTGIRTGGFDAAMSTLPDGWQIVYDDSAKEIRLETVPTGYAAWISIHSTSGLDGFSEDADDDRIPNGLEFLMGGDPTIPNDTPTPTLIRGAGNEFTYTFTRAARARGTTGVIAQFSDDLVIWPPSRDLAIGANTVSSGLGVSIVDQGDHDRISVTFPSITASTFVRIKMSGP